MSFKRLKSLAHLDDLRARGAELARVDLLAKLIAAVRVDLGARQMRTFSPWDVPLHAEGQPLATHPGASGGAPELAARGQQVGSLSGDDPCDGEACDLADDDDDSGAAEGPWPRQSQRIWG